MLDSRAQFTMFLVDRSGTQVRRFATSRTPDSITAEIEQFLDTQ